ncbi:MAG: recombinase family protein, partial [Oscillospiraceae bacterium]|nr:recombinase family protein [Oscillospiraceae bacterium]
ENKTEIIQQMMAVYERIGNASSIRADIAKMETEIQAIHQRKDKLLDLNIDGKISDDEFQKRNERYNMEIEQCRQKMDEYRQQQMQNDEIAASIDALRAVITRELNFEEGMDNALIDRLIDRIEVYQTGDRKHLNLKVYVKAIEDQNFPFSITRNRGKESSVCSASYT